MRPSRRHRHVSLALSLLGLALLATPAPAGAGSQSTCGQLAAGSVELCATTTVETSTTGRVRVRVPTDANIDLSPAPAITGDGRIVGFLLTEPGTRLGFWARVIRYPNILNWGIRTQANAQMAEEDREPTSGPLEVSTGWGCSVCHIPPGEYDLYVIADGSPVSVTLDLEGLDGQVHLADEDLMPAYSRQIDGFNRSGTLDTLDQTTSSKIFCCDEISTSAHTFIQFATRSDTDTVARASHRVCFRTGGASECDRGYSTHEIVGTSTTDGLIGWRTAELEPGRYEFSSRFDATNSAEGFTWQVDAVALVLGIAPVEAVRAPRIFDPGGDANGLGAADVHRDTRPASWDPADLLLVRFETTYDEVPVGEDGIDFRPTGVAIRFKTLASPNVFVGDAVTHYRLATTIAGCPSHLLGVLLRDQDTGGLRTYAAWDQHDAACPDGLMAHYNENRVPEWTASIDPQARELRIYYPFGSLSAQQAQFLKIGNALSAPRAETHSPDLPFFEDFTDTRVDVAPTLDTTAIGEEFVIGSDVPQDIPCTKGCP